MGLLPRSVNLMDPRNGYRHLGLAHSVKGARSGTIEWHSCGILATAGGYSRVVYIR